MKYMFATECSNHVRRRERILAFVVLLSQRPPEPLGSSPHSR